MGIKFSNFATALLAGGLTGAGPWSFSVATGKGAIFPAYGASDYSYGILKNASGDREIVKVTGRSGDSFTVDSRALDGTSSGTWIAGDEFSLGLTNIALQEIFAPNLSAIAGLASAADTLAYFTGSGTAGLATLTNFARTILGNASASEVLTTLGISAFIKTLLDDTDGPTALTTLGALAKAGGTMTGALNEAKGADVASAATIDLSAATGNLVHVTGTTQIDAITLAVGAERVVVFDSTPRIAASANLILPGGLDIVASAGDIARFRGDSGGVVRCSAYTLASSGLVNPRTNDRQCVVAGPWGSIGTVGRGFLELGGAVGATSITTQHISASSPLIVSAAGGWNSDGSPNDRTVVITQNLTWSGLSSTGSYYLYIDIASDGTVSTGSSTLAPSHDATNAFSTTNGQYVFSPVLMVGKVGNGTIESKVYRVYVGAAYVTVSTVSTFTWSLIGTQYSGTSLPISSAGSSTSVAPLYWWTNQVDMSVKVECKTADAGYGIGDLTDYQIITSGGVLLGAQSIIFDLPFSPGGSTNQMGPYPVLFFPTGTVLRSVNYSTGGFANLTPGSWVVSFNARRGW